jgi:hypothetical protein
MICGGEVARFCEANRSPKRQKKKKKKLGAQINGKCNVKSSADKNK